MMTEPLVQAPARLWAPRRRGAPRVECAPFGFGLSSAGRRAGFEKVNFDPSQFTGMRAWYRGDSLVDDGGGAASSWTDKGANGYNISAPVGHHPVIATNAVGTRSGATVVSAPSFNYFSNVALGAALTDFTIFAVVKPGTVGAGVMRSYCAWAAFAPAIGNYGASPDIYLGGHYTFSDLTQSAGTGYFVEMNRSGSNFNAYQNGAASTANPKAGVSTATGTNFTIGTDANFSEVFEGTILEIVVLDHQASAGERSNMHAYVQSYYGLP